MQIVSDMIAKGQIAHLPEASKTRALAGRRVSRRSLSRWIFGLLVVAVSLTGIYMAGFAVFANHVAGLKTPVDPPRADAIIVLTGGQARLKAATALLQAGKGERLLISGVHPSARSLALRNATGAGTQLYDCCIDIDRMALDTIGNAVESSKWLQSNGYSSTIVVTNNYHLPRSLLEMHRRTTGIKLIAYPVVNSDLAGGGWLTNPDALRVLFTEYGKYVMALMRG